MSWNNNGNNGSRDPWGGKDGPPDIDEALKKFREQFSFLFGKKSFENLLKYALKYN